MKSVIKRDSDYLGVYNVICWDKNKYPVFRCSACANETRKSFCTAPKGRSVFAKQPPIIPADCSTVLIALGFHMRHKVLEKCGIGSFGFLFVEAVEIDDPLGFRSLHKIT